jgi:hypothetical protein
MPPALDSRSPLSDAGMLLDSRSPLKRLRWAHDAGLSIVVKSGLEMQKWSIWPDCQCVLSHVHG